MLISERRFRSISFLLGLALLVSGAKLTGAQEASAAQESAGASESAGAGEPVDGENSEQTDDEGESTGESSAAGETTATEAGDEATGKGVESASSDTPTASEDPIVGEVSEEEYKRELDSRIEKFRKARKDLAEAIADQREIYIRYLNGEDRNPERRRAYFEMRDEVRRCIDEAFATALDVTRIGFDEEAATLLTTMVLHRLDRDIYDVETLEAAALLIDGGANQTYLFQAAARCAVVSGQFDMAKKLLEVMKDENQEEVDNRLEFNLEQYREQYLAEAEMREKEALEDRLPRVLLKTTQGDVVVELFIDQAPSAVAHFISLVEEGFYDGLDFNQVIDHLLALTGDPSGTGNGNSGKFVLDEHLRPGARYGLRGSLVLAKLPMGGENIGTFIPNSGSSQFAILLLPILAVSEEQTIFGRVIEGMDAVSRLRRVDPSKKKQKGERVYPPDSIIEATVIRKPDSMPEPQYAR